MPENSWRESDLSNDLQSNLPNSLPNNPTKLPTNTSLGSERPELFSEPPSESGNSLHGQGRRRKAAIALTAIWSSTIALHLFAWGYWLVLGLTTVMGIHALRLVFARSVALPDPLSGGDPEDYPYVSLMVAAKNEEAVVRSLVQDLCNLDYPASRYDLWIIDDASTDRTPLLLDRLAQEYQQLNVVHRLPNSGGGKSGALNQVLPLTQGDIIAVFDADAHVPSNLLRQVVPMFQRSQLGAVQVRKAIANATTNLWTRGQEAEMALDSFIQQRRIALGGIGELRGNGQFVRRSALERCGGWNEETITDDLDLTVRLHLDQWDIDLLMHPAVGEEGVTRAVGLWHQRNRWAEGGYQRYLDYWRLIAQNRLGTRKTVDLFLFWMTQYVLPTAAVPDFLMAIVRSSSPMLLPVTSLTVTLSMLGMFVGMRRARMVGEGRRKRIPLSVLMTLIHTAFGAFYMLHWIPVMASTTARMSIRPKRLKWVKTVHQGSNEVWLDMVQDEV
ncbi:MAG: glycosyltransferase family 2 protein [Oscillatoriophycideae cyanobacterium NC_groundwater_1537_Pr4_S-0.65um_50_18]|nr:glycosyltransferase family 2 protein [Oscillatoriophycideae cyanobacterium NC_groundwater_1537_Pr4_S-0.65um_50_18]